MLKQFDTAFWQGAYRSLPESVRARYLADLQAAERWELRIEALIETWSRAKERLIRLSPAH